MRNWKNIEWIFEKDGALRDIYVQNATISDWQNVVDLLNSEYKLTFGVWGDNLTDKIDFEVVKIMFADETGELEIKSATIDLNGIIIKCYFFLENQIEFDINPAEIKTELEFNKISNFMKSISLKLEKQITLCGENQPEFPLIKIDTKNGVEKILSEKEAKNLWKKLDKNISLYAKLKSNIIMKYFPKLFERRILESGNKEYKSTPIEKNAW
ncbi:hypothetical protein Q73A0000_05600 [Kaistella flava (ex Peng et al. 2021)]|uniref:Uncharacterized protein n=1 Tax=Kaistella flava (ex Peng et al. 2021) TaxID=2038776 RepID=A0A7M2Y953_9FLAO|nr:hypothetical protein [Kaistella flava (ex Peng et al. 2021)]QOW09873.1 hypothetical protein Q73A0000_05600 [Kaistella flava (ex Peng et al. 2021)]